MTTPSIEERLARLEGAYEQINLRLGRLEEETRALHVEMREGFNFLRAELNAQMNRLEGRMDHLEGRMDRLEGRMDRLFYATMALMGGIIAAIVAVILTRLL